MDLVAMCLTDNHRNLKMTVLHRLGGVWHSTEVYNLTNGLMTEVSGVSKYPEHLVLFGHHTKQATLRALGGGTAYTALQVTGIGSKDLPFVPGFA